MATVTITKTCIVCGNASTITVDRKAYEAWQGGVLIQDAFPSLSPDEREVLISGTHAQCWDTLAFDQDEDDVYEDQYMIDWPRQRR